MINTKMILICATSLLLLGACGKKDSNNVSAPGAGGNSGICQKLPCFYSVKGFQGGALGGISGADTLCQTEYPEAKAFLVDSTTRSASSLIDWVLDPNTTYYQKDGTLIGTTTDDRIFDFEVSSLTNPLISEAGEYWTGMNSDWSSKPSNCGQWTTKANNFIGAVGITSMMDNHAIFYMDLGCNFTKKLLCVAH